MAEKYFKDQYDDETVLLVFRKHPVVMRKYLIAASFVLLAGTIPSFIKPELSYFFGGLAAGTVLGGLVLFYRWVGWYYSVFIVTDQRLIQITQEGLFSKSVVDIALDQIQMVNYQVKGLQETLLGFGTLSVQTMVGELTINDVHKPADIQKELNHILRTHIQGVETNDQET